MHVITTVSPGLCITPRRESVRGLEPVGTTLIAKTELTKLHVCLSVQVFCYLSYLISKNMLISSSHGGEYDVQSCLLGYTAV
jgi:hypothetical protein